MLFRLSASHFYAGRRFCSWGAVGKWGERRAARLKGMAERSSEREKEVRTSIDFLSDFTHFPGARKSIKRAPSPLSTWSDVVEHGHDVDFEW